MIPLDTFKFNMKACFRIYHPDQAKKSFWPKSFRSFAKLNMKVYISTVGSATPSIRRGCPPKIECTIPQNAVDARVCTAVKVPSVKHSNPNQINMPQKKRLCLLQNYKYKRVSSFFTSIPFQLLPERYYRN